MSREDQAEPQVQQAAELLCILAADGLSEVQKKLSLSDRDVTRRKARLTVLKEVESALIKAREEVLKKSRELPELKDAFPDIHLVLSLKEIRKKCNNPDAREILEIIANGISSGARTVAAAAVSGAHSAVEKMIAVKKAVSGFFTSLAAKFAVAKTSVGAALANRFSKIAGGIDSGAVSLANGMTKAGLKIGNASVRAGASASRTKVAISEAALAARHKVAQAIEPRRTGVPILENKKVARVQVINDARDKSLAARGTQATKDETARNATLRGRQDARQTSRVARSGRAAEAIQARHGKPKTFDDFKRPGSDDPISPPPVSGAPISPSPTPGVPRSGDTGPIR
jgi:hypothetical protein